MYKPFGNSDKVYLPLFHIKFGLMKNFVKVMERNGQGFLFVQNEFPMINGAKIRRSHLLDH